MTERYHLFPTCSIRSQGFLSFICPFTKTDEDIFLIEVLITQRYHKMLDKFYQSSIVNKFNLNYSNNPIIQITGYQSFLKLTKKDADN